MVESNCDCTSKRRVILLLVVIGVILTSYADLSVQASSNYYDQHESNEPMFQDAPSSEVDTAVSLTDDARFPVDEPSWELKLSPETKPPTRMKLKPKRTCGGLPSVATRGLIGSTIKRSEFAINRSELERKLLKAEQTRRKRETKRNVEAWACKTIYQWLDMGVDHYPRYVRTAKCEDPHCANGLFQCYPKTYKTKVLKRVAPADSPACEENENDDSLPEALRSDWRLKTVIITHCCSCSARFTGPT